MPIAITTYWLNVYQMPGATLKSLDISECNVPGRPWIQHIANQTKNAPNTGEFALNQTDCPDAAMSLFLQGCNSSGVKVTRMAAEHYWSELGSQEPVSI